MSVSMELMTSRMSVLRFVETGLILDGMSEMTEI